MKVFLSPTQTDFVSSGKDYTLFAGGLGSGKTHAGAVWAILMALKYPKSVGLITANTNSQLRKATLAKLFELLQEWGIEFAYKQQENIIFIGDAKIYAISMERYDHLRGIEAGWAWSDEVAFYREDAYNVLIGRIRDIDGPNQWKGTTTPNGFNWLYQKFVERPPGSSKVIKSSTSENAENLKGSYVQDLRTQYDSKLAKQELDGEFVNLTSGKVYYNFDRNLHVKKTNDANRYIIVGLDFNVDPLCGVYTYKVGNQLHITKELYLRDSNTFAAAKEILKTYPQQSPTIVADETGNRRKTASSVTDHEILRRANLEVVPFKNPAVKDRYNNMNRLFEQNRIVIDPSCKMLIKDLEQLTYESNDDLLSHISDALGYAAWHVFPMKKPRREGKITYR